MKACGMSSNECCPASPRRPWKALPSSYRPSRPRVSASPPPPQPVLQLELSGVQIQTPLCRRHCFFMHVERPSEHPENCTVVENDKWLVDRTLEQSSIYLGDASDGKFAPREAPVRETSSSHGSRHRTTLLTSPVQTANVAADTAAGRGSSCFERPANSRKKAPATRDKKRRKRRLAKLCGWVQPSSLLGPPRRPPLLEPRWIPAASTNRRTSLEYVPSCALRVTQSTAVHPSSRRRIALKRGER